MTGPGWSWCTRVVLVYPALLYPGVPRPTTPSYPALCTPSYTPVSAVHTAGLVVYTTRVVPGAVLGLLPHQERVFLTVQERAGQDSPGKTYPALGASWTQGSPTLP